MTTPSLNGATLQSAADSAFSQQSVNGVLIFIARNERRDMIVPDRAGVQAGWFTPDVLAQIRTAMEDQFKAENYDAGISGAVGSAIANLSRPSRFAAAIALRLRRRARTARFARSAHLDVLVDHHPRRRIFDSALDHARGSCGALFRRRAPPPGGAPPSGGYGPGYGPGYGYGGYGGGGSFWSGLLGGLGGAWLGNELFRGGGIGGGGRRRHRAGRRQRYGGADAGGWQSDAGQAGMGSGGDWSGGGFGSDFGGGGDVGGGGGDSGGGW